MNHFLKTAGIVIIDFGTVQNHSTDCGYVDSPGTIYAAVPVRFD